MSDIRIAPRRLETSMPGTQQQGRPSGVETGAPRLLVLDDAWSRIAQEIELLLDGRGFRVVPVGSGAEALKTLRQSPPALAIVPGDGAGSPAADIHLAEVRAAARKLDIPVLTVVDPGAELNGGTEWMDQTDDWVVRGGTSQELAARINRLLRRPRSPKPPPIDAEFSALVVHDLRTPLNVIGLSMRMI